MPIIALDGICLPIFRRKNKTLFKTTAHCTICGKGASMLGTFAVSLVSQLSGSTSLGVGAIALFFLVGLILFRSSLRARA